MAIQIEPSRYPRSGLYLTFGDGHTVVLTHATIEERSRALLDDPAKVPPHVHEAESFQLCDICPKRGTGDACHAIRPILAVWEHFDAYPSYEPVMAVFRGARSARLVSVETTLQRALQYVSILSLLYYCETGKNYWRYFAGVHPLMDTDELIVHVYLNMFWASDGSAERTRALVAKFNDEITTTTRCQMERIRLFCHEDSFLNALILTQLASEFMALDVDDVIRRHLDTFETSFFA